MTTFLTTTGIKRILIEQNAQFYLKAENGTATAVIEKGENKLTVSKCIYEFKEALTNRKFWQKNRRHGDNIRLMELTGKTDPTIRKYLNTGNVPDGEIVEKITNFFKDRLEKEKELLN